MNSNRTISEIVKQHKRTLSDIATQKKRLPVANTDEDIEFTNPIIDDKNMILTASDGIDLDDNGFPLKVKPGQVFFKDGVKYTAYEEKK